MLAAKAVIRLIVRSGMVFQPAVPRFGADMFAAWVRLAIPLAIVGVSCAVLSDAPFGIIPLIICGGVIYVAFHVANGLS